MEKGNKTGKRWREAVDKRVEVRFDLNEHGLRYLATA